MTDPGTTEDRDTRYCGAKKRQGEGNCRRPAGWGTDHVGAGPCKLHGGSTAAHRTAARKRLADERAARTLAEFGYERVDDPVEHLVELASQARALVDFWAGRVNELGSVRYQSEQGTEQLRSEVVLYERAMDRAQKFLAELVKLGFEERRVEVAEADGRRLADVLLATIDGLFGVLAGVVDAGVIERLRREEVPRLVRGAIEATGRETPQ